jgi:hypothetical protein
MGRPIKKKFFANLLSPFQDHATGGPTGEGEGANVATVTITSAGSGYTTLPGLVFSAPDTTDGTTATGTATSLLAVSATVGTSGTGDTTADYVVGDELAVAGGATFDVAAVLVRTVAVQAAGTSTWTTGDTVTFSSGWDTPAVLTITDDGSGGIDSLTITDAGVYSGAALTDPVSPDSASVADAGGYQGDATFNIGFGVESVTLTASGTYATVVSNPVATTTDSANGTGATLNVSYGVGAISVTSTGSGYVNVPTVTPSAGNATFAATLTAGGSSGLFVTAFLLAKDGGVSADGADIMKQEASTRYLVRNNQGKGQCRLVAKANGSLLAGEMNLIATDHLGGTYYVTKLTARRARLVRATGTFYVDNQTAGWTVGSASVGIVDLATS